MLGVALALGCCHRLAQAMGRSTMCKLSGMVDRTDILHLCQQPSLLLFQKLVDKSTTSAIRATATNERKF
ncbi:hypothetical protein E5S67_01441 [Microcoleus sp. IPMA8]|uniref:Secreted protein n=1 Tax=Microcoleus asticus IPMA8 TaxID=2563858 RepID=A0ABX2CVY3_9CYAN|nr:hypothetical protein [Microcoleus asticus IPMA8]